MFGNCPALFEGSKDLSGWNTKKFTNLFGMFYSSSLKRRNYWGAVDPSKLTHLHNSILYFPNWSPNIGGWDVGNVTNFANMCYSAGTFNDDLSGWDVSSGINFGRMLHNCFLFNHNLSSWNVSNATDMHEMFRGCNTFNNGGSDGIKDWDVSNVTDFGEMFFGNVNFNQPLTNWDTSSATIMHRMFYNASSFNQSIAHFNTSNVISMARMLQLSSVNQDLSSWNLSSMSTDAIVPTTQLPPIVDVFRNSAMSKANLDATIQGWCTTIPSGLDLGQIPLDGTGGNVLHADTITAMVGKSLTAQYTDGTEVTS
jgi:surface protein